MTLLVQLVFLIIPLLFIGFGLLIGRKLKWQFSLTKIAVIAVSAIIAALVSASIANGVSHVVADMLVESGILGEFADLTTEVKSAKEVVCAFAAMIAAPILYLPLFLIIRGILGLVNRLVISRFYLKKEEGEKSFVRTSKKSPWCLVAGAVCGIFLCSAIMLPLVGTLTAAGAVTHIIAGDIDDGDIAGALDAMAGAGEVNTSSVIVTATGGKLVYNMMTTYDVLGTKVSLLDEADFIGAVGGAVLVVADENAENETKAQAIRYASEAFKKSNAFPLVIGEVIDVAEEDWNEGREFCGIAAPSLGDDQGDITNILLDCVKRSSKDTIKEDIGSVAEVLAIIFENDCWSGIQEDPIHFIENEDVTAKILFVFVENERTYPAIDDIVDFGIDNLFASFGAFKTKADAYAAMVEEVKALAGSGDQSALSSIVKKYGLDIDKNIIAAVDLSAMNETQLLAWFGEAVTSSAEDFASKTALITPDQITANDPVLTDAKKEAATIAHVLSVAVDVIDHMGDEAMEVSDLLNTLGPVFDAIASTETLGAEKTALVLKGILQSEKVYGEIGFTMGEATMVADKIIEGSKSAGFSPMLLSLGQMIEVVSSATSSNNIGDSVQVLLENLTPETAGVLTAVATPDAMKNYGVAEENAEAASKLLSDMLSKLSDSKEEMDEESLNKETSAVTDIVNIMMSTGTGDVESIFGEDGALGVEAEKYIDNIISSDIVSDALIDAVYGEEEEVTRDPLGIGIELTESEISQLESIINDKWTNASESEKTEGDLEKLLVSIGAIVNADISIVNGQVVVNK